MYGKHFSNNSYTGVFIKPLTVIKLRTLGQLRHVSGASACAIPKTSSNLIYSLNIHVYLLSFKTTQSA